MRYGIGDIRRENVLAVMDALVREKMLTRGEIARRCALSPTTVGKVIDELMDYGVLSQQQSRSEDYGRTPTKLCFSDRAPLVLFRLTARERVMVLINLRMQILLSVRREVHADLDPNEELRTFLMDCRQPLAAYDGKLLICGLCTEGDPEAESRTIYERLNCRVEVAMRTAEVLSRGAQYEGIATDDNCAVILADGITRGTIWYHGSVRESDISQHFGAVPYGEVFSQAMMLLCSLLCPDVLLLCVREPSEELRHLVERALSGTHAVHTELRQADAFLALGMGVLLREAWLDHIVDEEKRLRTEEKLTIQ